MKTKFTVLFLAITSIAFAQKPSDTLLNFIKFENLKEAKPGYGLSSDQPLLSGAFINTKNNELIKLRMRKLQNSFRWADGGKIDFSKRSSTHKDSGMVDIYTLTDPTTQKQVKLYVDPYKTDSVYYVPEGLTLVDKKTLLKEASPTLKLIEAYYTDKDAFNNQKANIDEIIKYIGTNIGVIFMAEGNLLRKVMSDTQASEEVKSHLFFSYVMSRFYAYATNTPKTRDYAVKMMKQDFLKLEKAHPDLKTGNIKINLNL